MESKNRACIVGVTRFSLLLPGATQWNLSAQTETLESYRERLYDPERLDARLKIFTQLSLPQLAKGSRGTDYRHIVQHSSSLPSHYQVRLRELSQQYDFLEIVCSDEKHVHDQSVSAAFRQIVPEQDRKYTSFAWFRLDDDDIVSDRYFDRIVPYVESEPPGRVVSLGLGYSMIYSNGQLRDLRRDYRPKNSIGQLYICAFDESSDRLIEPPRGDHSIIDQFAPTLLDSRQPSFITVVHPMQDGRAHLEPDQALAAVEKEQGNKPIVAVEGLEAEFSQVRESNIVADFPLAPVMKEQSLSVEPVRESVGGNGDLVVEAQVTAAEVQTEGRVILGTRFASGTRPPATGRWVEVDRDTLAVGFVVNAPKMKFRAHLLGVPAASELVEMSVWVSRSFQGSVDLDDLQVGMRQKQ